jgi:hypothetical protein
MDEFLSQSFLRSLNQFQKIRNFEGDATQFWRLLLDTLIDLCGALSGLIFIKTNDDNAPWKTLAKGPVDKQSAEHCNYLSEIIPVIAERCSEKGYAHIPHDDFSVIAINLMVDVDPHKCYAVFFLYNLDEAEAALRIDALLSARDIPAQFRIQKAANDALQNQAHLAGILDIIVLLNSKKKFLSAVMTICNEFASRYSCNRVSLGWLTSGYVKIQAMSHTDKFEKKMEAVQLLELAMEEAIDQETDILSPVVDGLYIVRDHEAYRKFLEIGPWPLFY